MLSRRPEMLTDTSTVGREEERNKNVHGQLTRTATSTLSCLCCQYFSRHYKKVYCDYLVMKTGTSERQRVHHKFVTCWFYRNWYQFTVGLELKTPGVASVSQTKRDKYRGFFYRNLALAFCYHNTTSSRFPRISIHFF